MKRIYILLLVAVGLAVAAWFLYKYNREQEEKKQIELYQFPHYIPRKAKQEEEVRNGVPLVIYESWNTHELPKGMCDNILQLLKTNPEFDYYLYSDEECAAFIADNYDKDVLMAFQLLKPGAYKSDLWRYCILYKLGGLYLDVKYYSTVPLINLIDENPTVFVRDLDKKCIYNAFMISPPKNEIFKLCIDDIVKSCKERLYKRSPLDITGPCLLGKIIIEKYGSEYIHNISMKHKLSLFNDRSISYMGKTILKEYDSYRLEQKQSRAGQYYADMYWKGDIYNEIK
jgi:mannosyltransferase OCH1-like enzyme